MPRLKLHGEIDVANSHAVLDEFLAEVSSDGVAPTVEIDCSDLEFIDSSGLNMLSHLAQQTGKTVVLIAVPDKCRRTFEITHLDHVFELRDS